MDVYENIRGELQTGDVILCSGRGFISEGIKRVTSSPYSHAAMIRIDHRRVMVYEAIAKGTVNRPLSLLAEGDHYSSISVFRPRGEFNADAAVTRLLDLLGREYAIKKIKKIWWREVFARLKLIELGAGEEHLDAFICSEYVSGALVAGGIDPCIKPDALTYPSDLAASPALEHIFTFSF